jgi:hypothetical protein
LVIRDLAVEKLWIICGFEFVASYFSATLRDEFRGVILLDRDGFVVSVRVKAHQD